MKLFESSPTDDRVRTALDALAAGSPVVVADDADRKNEGDLIFAAEMATPELVAFMVRHTSGFVCVALTEQDCTRLDLPPMHHTQDRFSTAYRTTVDVNGAGTGISAAARAMTIAALSASSATPADFGRPGHVVPLSASTRGVLGRRGHTEAAVDLARLAGLRPAGALCEIVSVDRPGHMARGAELQRFAATYEIPFLTIDDIVGYRLRAETTVRRAVTTALPTDFGEFQVVGYADLLGTAEHIALVAGDLDAVTPETPVHVHVECLSGGVLRSHHCRCAQTLHEAMQTFADTGAGIVIYLRPSQAPRGCGLPAGPASADIHLITAAEWIVRDLRTRPGVEQQPAATAIVSAA